MRVFLSAQTRVLTRPLRHRFLSDAPLTSAIISSDDIQCFYNKYVNAFVNGDMKTVSTEYYRAPVNISMSMHGKVIMQNTFNTSMEIEQALMFQMESLLNRGYANKSDMEPITITDMTDVAKLIQTEGIRYHTSGEVLEKIKASYVIESADESVTPDTTSEEEVVDSKEKRWFITAIYGEITPVLY